MSKNSMRLDGGRELERLLRSLPDRVQRKVTRQAVNAGATPILKAARANAAKRSGLLRKSLGKKVVTNKQTHTAAAIIGARKQVVGPDGEKPARYAHLVEKGHIDGNGNHVPAQPFLNPALSSTQSQAIGTVQAKLAEGIEREARKGAK